ncbi:MAG: EamA family transporter [Nitrospinota bacterium]|nr:EamA family transporter [Nitrospinota bacterium]
MDNKSLGWGFFAVFCWGTLATAAGGALEKAHPAWVLGGAFLASSAAFALLPRLMGLEHASESREARGRWRGRLLGLWGLFFFHAFYFEAIRRAPIVEATLINYLWPLLIVLMAWLVLREPFRPAIAAGVLLGAAGAALVVGGQSASFEVRHFRGYALGSAAAWSSYTVMLRRWVGGREFLLPASIWSALLSRLWLAAAGWPEPPPPETWGGRYSTSARSPSGPRSWPGTGRSRAERSPSSGRWPTLRLFSRFFFSGLFWESPSERRRRPGWS